MSHLTDIYRQKLQQCLEDKALSDDDVAALNRLRVLLCVPKAVVDKAHGDVCGDIFTKVSKETACLAFVECVDNSFMHGYTLWGSLGEHQLLMGFEDCTRYSSLTAFSHFMSFHVMSDC